MKKYVDIERLKEKYLTSFSVGEHIVCQEKIDGANSSICYDAEKGFLKAFSRRQELSETNTLRGFYDYVLTLDPVKWSKATTNGRYIVFGEWLVAHSVKYPDALLNHFYVFDVWDTETEQYMPWSFTVCMAEELGLRTVPVFYDGEFTSWEDLYSLVGRTDMLASPTGEGIVIKSQDRLDNKSSKTPAYVKIVAKEFSEVHQSKPKASTDPEVLAKKAAAMELAETIVTERRIVKCLEKLIEDDIIPLDWDEKDMSIIARTLPKMVYQDCVKEEPEIVAQIENFGKICGKIVMVQVRDLIK